MTARQISKYLLPIVYMLAVAIQGTAQKPLWVQNGVKSLNDNRISKDYRFEEFKTTYSDQPFFTFEPLSPFKDYIAESYGVASESVLIDSIVAENGARVTYSATFPSPVAEENTVVYARLVDKYIELDDNVDGTWDYNIYQLFAVSAPDITPVFDDFEVTRQYNQVPLAMSLVPGLGQIRKGQKAKGYAIMGTEAVVIGSIIYFAVEANRYEKLGRENPGAESSFDNKASFFRAARNVALVIGGGLYLYNLLDAALAKGAPHVLIKQGASARTADLSFHPVVTPCSAGIGVSLIF